MPEISDSMVEAFYKDPQNVIIQPVCKCDDCRGRIYPGDTMFRIRGMNFCEDCVKEGEMEADCNYEYD